MDAILHSGDVDSGSERATETCKHDRLNVSTASASIFL